MITTWPRLSAATRHSLTRLCILLACTLPAAAQKPQPTFDVATVRPAAPDADPRTGQWSLPNTGRFTASHVSLALLIRLAYDIDDSQIANKPGWLEDNLYDVVAKPEPGIQLSREELRPRLQSLLHDRFHLVVHTQATTTRGYALVASKGGPHLTPTKAEHFPGWRTNVSPGQMQGVNWSMPQFAKFLTEASGFPVIDQTNITGSYDIAFSYAPRSDDTKPDDDLTLLPLNAALEQATGLVLKSQKVPSQLLVIDHADKVPVDN